MKKEKEEARTDGKDKYNGNKNRKCGIKFSRNLLFNVYGHMAGNIYSRISNYNRPPLIIKRTIEITADCPLLKETKKFFENRGNGFYLFIERFIKNRNLFKFREVEENQESYSLEKMLTNNSQMRDLYGNYFSLNEKNRYLTMKNEEVFRDQISSATKLQTQIRSHLARNNFLRLFREELKRKTTCMVICIQKHFRRYRTVKLIKIILLVENILTERKQKSNTMKKLFQNFKCSNKIKKDLLIRSLLEQRKDFIILIQKFMRTFLLKQKVKVIMDKEKNFYTVTYPFKAKRVRLIIYVNSTKYIEEKVYNFQYCNFRDIFVLYIQPKDFKSGKYRVRLIVDNEVTCDGRFPHIEFSDGHYYNIIEFSLAKEKLSSLKGTDINTHPDTLTEDIGDKADSLLEGSVKNCSNGTYSDNSFLRALRKEIPLNEVDKDLRKNLESKEHQSYIEILKASIESNNLDHEDN